VCIGPGAGPLGRGLRAARSPYPSPCPVVWAPLSQVLFGRVGCALEAAAARPRQTAKTGAVRGGNTLYCKVAANQAATCSCTACKVGCVAHSVGGQYIRGGSSACVVRVLWMRLGCSRVWRRRQSNCALEYCSEFLFEPGMVSSSHAHSTKPHHAPTVESLRVQAL
jgi:hypothetical protein